MKLYIAEKPSLGRAIAEVLPQPHQRGEGFIRVGNGDVVSWCIGHLLEQAEPETYNEAFKQWRLEHLPIIPQQWQLQPKAQTRKQLTVLRKLVKEAEKLVHAGDPDREGQLLVDQVIAFLGVKGRKLDSVERCLISDLNPEAVKRALGQLRPNRDFVPLSTSALARSRADWLYGINMTRAYTLQGRKVGFEGLLSVGRVQTPVLGLVVRRDRDIEAFVSKPFFEVLAHVQTGVGEIFKAKWKPSDVCEPYMDEDGRMLSKALAVNVITRIAGQMATVSGVDKKPKSQAAPLPYSLSSLQIDAAKRFGFSAKQVLDLCQVLYERHKLVTYPRSDSRYLPVEHFKQASQVLAAIGANVATQNVVLASAIQGADTRLKSRAWNDSKVDAHHAIIPTTKKTDLSKLSVQERQVYELIARQYLMQFYPKWDYRDTTVELTIAGGIFLAKARNTTNLGWKILFEKPGDSRSTKRLENNDPLKLAGKSSEDNGEEFTAVTLPEVKTGDTLLCTQGELLEKTTQPPNYFTDATLLSAMTGIARFVTDPEIRKILKETDGLGTEATRAGILDLLFKRGFLSRQGKQIRATHTARGLIDSLPASATTPDMTAQWEATLAAISQKQTSYNAFMQPLTATLQALIAQSQVILPTALKGIKTAKPRAYKKSRKSPKNAAKR